MMTFRVVHKPSNSHVRCPYRVIEQNTDREIEWINQYLGYETLRRLADTTLRTYADACCTFLRWWESVHHTDKVTKDALTEDVTLLRLCAIPVQPRDRQVDGSATIQQRVAIVDRALRIAFPGAPGQIAPALQSTCWQRAPMGIGKPLTRLEPIACQDCQTSHRAFVRGRSGALLGRFSELSGPVDRGTDAPARSAVTQEVLDPRRDDLLLSESQIRVRSKGDKIRFLPLAPEGNGTS